MFETGYLAETDSNNLGQHKEMKTTLMRTLNVLVIFIETDPRSVDLRYRLCKQ